MSRSRQVLRVVQSQWQSEGRGARVRRSVGRPELRHLDPFLLLDEFEGSAREGAGFPDHPHRGFETVSYLLEGEFTHEDFSGNKGTLRPGDLQWMTAGRGIVHCEMPGWERARGLQLWVNLASQDKMVEPSYQELQADQIPTVSHQGVTVRVIAGTSMGVSSPVRTRTPTYYLDFTLRPGAVHLQQVPAGWTTLVYTLEGRIQLGAGQAVPAHHTVLFSQEGEGIHLENVDNDEARLVMISGEPIGEPIAQHGPFVMNTREELEQAFQDYHHQKNGFEKAKNWRSVGGNL